MKTKIKINIILILLLFHAPNSFGTMQQSDGTLFEGNEYSVISEPLEPFFEKYPDKRPNPDIISSGLWRGYIATFEVIDSILTVKDIIIQVSLESKSENASYAWKSVKNDIFPNDCADSIIWEDQILILYGEIIEYGYPSICSNYVLLEITNNIISETLKLNHQQLLDVKQKQLKEFKKTDEYKKLRKDHIGRRRSKLKGFDEYVETFIFYYTSQILFKDK